MTALDSVMEIIIVMGLLAVVLVAVGLIFAKLYTRASKEVSFVRTGLGGQKVIMNSGAFVIPVLHEVIPVNMNTLRLAVERARHQALITCDRMRVDVIAEFYVRVQPTVDSIANAAQTLGQRTMQPDLLKELVEGKFVDALRSVAAELSMEQLHEKRVDFVQKVQQAVSEDLLKNGLELESVSLTGLDQTGREYFNPDNAFDAEGLTRLTEEIERRKKIRNDIEQETAIQIKQRNFEAEKESLSIERETEYARLMQQQELEVRRAVQHAEIEKQRAAQQQTAEQAKILSSQQVEHARIQSERVLTEQRIEKERFVKEKQEIAEKLVQIQFVEKQKNIELAEQDKAIAIAERSQAQSEALAQAEKARILAVEAEEAVITARETEVAKRQKQIELIAAAKQAEMDAVKIKIAAEAEVHAADDKAEAMRIDANAKAEQAKIIAEGEAEADKIRSSADSLRYQIEAKGKELLNMAENILSAEQVNKQVKLALIEKIENMIRESVKPLEAIDSIKIFQLDGLAPRPTATAGNHQSSASLSDQVVDSALRYRAQQPLLDSLLKEIGLSEGTLADISHSVSQATGLVEEPSENTTSPDFEQMASVTEESTVT